jgi:hypothetical protein
MLTLQRALALFVLLVPAPRLVAQEISPPIPLAGDLSPASAAGVQGDPDVARGGSQYLVVWEDARSGLSGGVSANGNPSPEADVYALRLDADGNRLDSAPIVVAAGPFAQVDPKVAWNGTNWLVVWTSSRATEFAVTRGLYAARVSPSGALLDDPPIRIDDDDGVDERFAYVASDGTGWAIVWPDLVGGTDMIAGCTVDANGVVGPKKVLATATSSFYLPMNARLAFCQGRYLMTSEHYTPGGVSSQFYDVYGQLFDAALNPLAPEFAISTALGSQVKTWVAANDFQFYVAWMFNGINGTPIALDGSVVVPGGLNITTQVANDPQPHVAWDGDGWLATWENGSVFGARLSAQGQITTAPFVIESGAQQGNNLTESVPAGGASVPGQSIVVWNDRRTEIGDLYAKTVDASGVGSAAAALVAGPPAQTHPSLDGTRDAGFLVAFLSETSGVKRVVAQRVDASGRAIDPEPIELFAGNPGVRAPSVAFDGAHWLVAWPVAAVPGTGLTHARVFARRVRADGVVLDAAPIDVMAGDQADVAALAGTFLVVASDEPVNHFRYVMSKRVDGATGALLDAADVQVSLSYARSPSVVALGGQWFVAWSRSTTHDSPSSSLRGAFVGAGGVPGPQLDLAISPNSHVNEPAITVVNDLATIVWSDGEDVRSRRVQSDGTALGSIEGTVVSSAPNAQFGCAIGNDGGAIVAAWTDYRAHAPLEPGWGDVFASRIDASGAALDPAGLALATSLESAEGTPAIAGDGGLILVADVELLRGGFGTHRVVLRAMLAHDASTPFCFGDGSGAACPCGNSSPIGEARGCLSSFGVGARLLTRGIPSLSADSLDLEVDGVPSAPVLFFQGTARFNGGAGAAFGDGLRCVGGSVIRLGIVTGVAGFASVPQPGQPRISIGGQIGAPAIRTYQAWYRNAASFCTSATFNLTNGVETSWLP